jgi:hypothetical protein
LEDDLISLDEPPVVATPRGRPSAARLNEAWQTFFRDALVPPNTARPVSNEPYYPPELPPPLVPVKNLPVGAPFNPCPRDSFRLWSLNANGLSIKDDYSAWHSMCANLVPYNVGAITLSEPNVDFLQKDFRAKIEGIFRLHFGSVRLITVTTCAKAPTSWKPGGVLLAVLGKWTQHVTSTSRDDLGRWVSATLTGSEGTQATVYSCYNVVKTSIANAGPSTVFAQQYQLLRLAGTLQPNPRTQFADDLNKEIAHRRQNKEEIILCGDFNERLGDDPNLMASICASHDLFDVLDTKLGDAADVPTYIRGLKGSIISSLRSNCTRILSPAASICTTSLCFRIIVPSSLIFHSPSS